MRVSGEIKSSNGSAALRSLRELVADAFSSISVLNASFKSIGKILDENTPMQRMGSFSSSSSAAASSSSYGGLNIDLQDVRDSYTLLMNLNDDLVLATLGRATLQMTERLMECPIDDAENLTVFLVALENPLLLRTESFHFAVERVSYSVIRSKNNKTTFSGHSRNFSATKTLP
jgi:hypothetical protein